MVEYIIVKLSDLQLNKLKSAFRNREGLTLRMKMLDGNNLPHEFLLTTRQKTMQEMDLKVICQLI